MGNLIIIDGNSLINRAFYALPPLSASDGTPSQAVFGFATMLIKLITEQKPDYITVAFDLPSPTFRHKEYDLYKATRKGMPDELAAQLEPLKQLLALMNITTVECAGYEADDIIGTIAKKSRAKTTIVTGDRDSLQLVDENISVFLTKRGITEILHVNFENFEKEIGMTPEQIIDYKALRGDTSDNIPGVAGIGDKTALNLLHEYGNLDNVYENIDKIKGALRDKLTLGKDSAYLSKKLAIIDTQMPIECDVSNFKYDFPFSEEVRKRFTFLGFRSLLKKDSLFSAEAAATITKKDKLAEQIKVTTLNTVKEILAGTSERISFHMDESIYFAFDEAYSYEVITSVDLLDDGVDFSDALQLFKQTLESNDVKKIVFDAKALKKRLDKFGILLKNYEDIRLMQYLADMSIDYSEAGKLTAHYYGEEAHNAAAFFGILNTLSDELDRLNMRSLYYDIELPLIEILRKMERIGFRIDTKRLDELGKSFSQKMNSLTQKIFELSGHEFNLNSPKQLADILFNKMNIPYPAKSKNYSTSAEILQEISDEHEIIDYILEYRTYFKLNNTYIDGLRKLVDGNETIHTEFRQMQTTTGRLSSVEPNLQNIPVRDEEGRILRELFVAGENRTLVSADYSQIELRLLAHCSGDKKLILSYEENADIHASTAAEVFSVKKEDVTDRMRRDAKAVNFGIIYGISDFGLAKNLKVPRYAAKKYIDMYFERFGAVKEYLNNSVEQAKKLGYAETLLGRKRKIPELMSHNYNIRQFGERAAMNMPLQGTAADIIKIAMINVDKALEGKKSKLILQVHDELIIDATDDELDEVKLLLEKNMSEALDLCVPLKVDVSAGKRWSDC